MAMSLDNVRADMGKYFSFFTGIPESAAAKIDSSRFLQVKAIDGKPAGRKQVAAELAMVLKALIRGAIKLGACLFTATGLILSPIALLVALIKAAVITKATAEPAEPAETTATAATTEPAKPDETHLLDYRDEDEKSATPAETTATAATTEPAKPDETHPLDYRDAAEAEAEDADEKSATPAATGLTCS